MGHQLGPSLALGVILASLAGCYGEGPLPVPRSELIRTDADEVRAALFLRLYREAVLAAPEVAGTTCISEGDAPVRDRVLTLLSDRGMGIRDGSRCVPRERRFVDAISGAPATVLSIRDVVLTEPGKASAFGVFGLGGLWCGGGEYALEFRLGRWEVSPVGSRIVC